MKTLYLVRHAKSSRDDPSLADRDRPLSDRGRKDARKMGKRLAKGGVKPDLLMSSPAVRALATAQLLADGIGYRHSKIVVDARLYQSSAGDLLAVVRALDKKVKRVMLFGHNPEFTDLAHRLSSEISHMPTCAIAEFRFDTKRWSDVGRLPDNREGPTSHDTNRLPGVLRESAPDLRARSQTRPRSRSAG